MEKTYKEMLENFSKELEAAIEERARLDRKIQRYKEVIKNISALAGVDSDEALSALTEYENRGLTSGIKSVLQVIGGKLTASEVRQSLIAAGYDLSNYANASSVINTVLTRLAIQGLLKKELTEKDGQMVTTYQWAGMAPRMRPRKYERNMDEMLKDAKKKK